MNNGIVTVSVTETESMVPNVKLLFGVMFRFSIIILKISAKFR